MPLTQRLLCLTLLLLPLSGGQFLQPSPPRPPAPRPCARLLPPEPQSPLPGGGGGQGHRLGQAGAPRSFVVAPGCELTLWGGQASRSFTSGKHLNVSLGLEGGPTAFHCSCQDQPSAEETEDKYQEETAYQKFLRQHLDPSVRSGNDKYCDKTMSRRRMTRPQCKEINTFIHAKKQEVVKVCSQKPLVKNLHQSNHTFRLTVCELKGRSTHKPCQYRGRDKVRTIIVACKDKKPVHLGK